MADLTCANDSKSLSPAKALNVIWIMRDVFDSEQLQDIVECLEGEGHTCEFFAGAENIPAAISDRRTKLLLVGAPGDEQREFVKIIKQNNQGRRHIPVLFYLPEPVSGADEELLLTVVDDFILKPLNLKSLLLRVRRLERGAAERAQEAEQANKSLIHHFGMKQFVGEAPSFLAVIEKIPRVGARDIAVLLTGDTGTGKEMCARAIHYMSERANKPFVAINCGSIPTDLFENELFGHEQGAFTDARRAQRGLIAEAEGGTLFLDEVNSLAPLAQVKLLRFLQDQQYKPLGTAQHRQANVRVIAASNQNLQQLVREHSFREDLYYRLNIVSMRLPTLSERHEDIMLLAMHFLKRAAGEYHSPAHKFSRDAVQKLISYKWPGNVRELENIVRQAVVMCEWDVIRASQLQISLWPLAATNAPVKESFKAAKARMIESFERDYLNEILSACDGNISKAAREAKKDRRAFFALLKKYGMTSVYMAQAQTDEEPPLATSQAA
jgi:DNA-binding NtrC family response regulator